MQAIAKQFQLTIAYYEKKEYPAAEKAVDELLAAHPDFERGQFLKAVILEETGRAGQAEEHYAKSGNRFTLWFRLASQLEEIDPQRAVAYYERTAKHDSQNNQLWFNLGNLYEKMGRKEEARTCFRKMQLLREVLSRVFIPLGFMVIMIAGASMMIKRGDNALATVVIASAVFCVFWLKRDGGKAVQMIRRKKSAS